MSNLETLLTAWLTDGEVPEDFQPETRIEEYLVAILEGVDDSVTPESRADVLLDAIATKYAGYATGITDLRDTLGFTGHPVYDDATTPELIAAAQKVVNAGALVDLLTKGVVGVDNNTIALFEAYSQLPSGGASLNIQFGNNIPEDTTKLWIKTDTPENITIDYNPDNTVESVTALPTVIPQKITGPHAAGVVGTTCYVFAGLSANAVYAFDANTDTLTTLPVTFPRDDAAVGVVGTKIYAFGGQRSGNQNTIYEYDTTSGVLSALQTTLPTAARLITCAAVGTKIYLFGGFGTSTLNTINVFDAETNTISTLSVTLPTASFGHAVGVVGTKIYLLGGSDQYNEINTIYVFDTTTNTISTLSVTLPRAMSGSGSATFGTKIYLFGGGSGNVLNTILVFDAETETVTTLTETLLQTNQSMPCGAIGNSAYLFGGWSGSAALDSIDKFTVTFPLNEGDIFIQEDMLRNKFTLVNEPTKVTVGVASVSKGNAGGYAENADAYLHDGTQWRQI